MSGLKCAIINQVTRFDLSTNTILQGKKWGNPKHKTSSGYLGKL